MWLLKLHFSISILCFLMFWGFLKVYKENIKHNGWIEENNNFKKSTKTNAFVASFIPIMNILLAVVVFLMIVCKKADFDKMCEEGNGQ